MDAHALLTSQGWRGTGHSLHPTSDSNGLSKPLLVSRKQNNLGIGKKQHKTSDMWWMNAFDSSLKGLDTSKEGMVVQTVTSGGLDMVARGGGKYVGKGGLYASFVRGESLSGTLTPEEVESETGEKAKNLPERQRKRKRGEENGSKEESSAKTSSSRKAKVSDSEDLAVKEPAIESFSGAPEEQKETKEQRRARKAAKRALEGRTAVDVSADQTQSDDAEKKGKRKDRNKSKAIAKADPETQAEVDGVQTTKEETKEERKERKRLKRLQQERVEQDSRVSSEESKKPKKKKKRPLGED